jgi:hypothetical protein
VTIAGVYRVQEDFGITPSATVDNTAALLSAINAVKNTPGPGGSNTVLDWGIGVYIMSAPLPTVDSNAYLRTHRSGDGAYNTTQILKKFDGDLFTVTAGSIHLRGLTIDMRRGDGHTGRTLYIPGTPGVNPGDPIISYTPFCTVRDLHVFNASGPMVETVNDQAAQLMIDDCYFDSGFVDPTVPLFKAVGFDSFGTLRWIRHCVAGETRLFDADGLLGLWASDCDSRDFVTTADSRTIMLVNNRFAVDAPGGANPLVINGSNVSLKGGAISNTFALGSTARYSNIDTVIDGYVIRNDTTNRHTNTVAGQSNYRRVSANVAVLPSDDVIECDGTALGFGIDMPTIGTEGGKEFTVANVGAVNPVFLGIGLGDDNPSLAPGQTAVCQVRNGVWSVKAQVRRATPFA